MPNIVKQTPKTDFSTKQTINPTLVFLSTSTTTPKPFSYKESHIMAFEAYPTLSNTSISFTQLLNPPKKDSEKIDNTTLYINNPTLLNCPIYYKQPRHRLNAKDPKYNIYKQKFNCTIIRYRRDFKHQDHLKRYIKSYSKEKPYIYWMPRYYRTFTCCNNLKAYYTKTHTIYKGYNRYITTFNKTSPYYNLGFRG